MRALREALLLQQDGATGWELYRPSSQWAVSHEVRSHQTLGVMGESGYAKSMLGGRGGVAARRRTIPINAD